MRIGDQGYFVAEDYGQFIVKAEKDLSARARCVLIREGYYTRADVYKGIKAGKIRPNSQRRPGLAHYGPKTHAEVCAWVGDEIEKRDLMPSPKDKSLDDSFLSVREFEKALRDHLGLSCRQAKRVAAGGWRALTHCKK